MSTRSTPWDPGTPNWVDLTTTDALFAHGFYADVLGWRIDDLGPEAGHYAICTRGGHEVASIGPRVSPEQPIAWTTYLAVEDADKTAEAVVTHGGVVLVPPMTVGDQGRLAVAVDPAGAPFGLWQAGRRIGAELVDEPGAMAWNAHRSADPEAARAFYAEVFGYTYTFAPGAGRDGEATIDGAGGGRSVGAIGGFDPPVPTRTPTPTGSPAHWAVWFGVADVDVAATTARARGGRLIEGPVDTPFGRTAGLADPQGARFSVVGIGATERGPG